MEIHLTKNGMGWVSSTITVRHTHHTQGQTRTCQPG